MNNEKYTIKTHEHFIATTDNSNGVTYYTSIEKWNLTVNLITTIGPKQNKAIKFLEKQAGLTETHAETLYKAAVQWAICKNWLQGQHEFRYTSGDFNGKI